MLYRSETRALNKDDIRMIAALEKWLLKNDDELDETQKQLKAGR